MATVPRRYAGSPDAVEVRLLGSLEVLANGRSVAVGGPRPRALLSVLALEVGAVVSVDRLVESLWDGDEPDGAVPAVQVYVSRLRKALGGAGSPAGSALRASAGGYLLDLPPNAVDVRRFELAADVGRAALAAGDAATAVASLADGLALWRGEPLADLGRAGDGLRARLAARRLSAQYDRAAAELALGRYPEAVTELEALVRRHPFDEKLVELLIVALYGSGRQADALTAYTQAAARLDDELGVEPSPGLRTLYQQVLRQEVPVVVPPPPATVVRPGQPVVAQGVPALPILRPPRPRTPLVGRQADLELALARLGDPEVSVLTLLGLGGAGKTRLALEIADRWDPDDVVVFVPLASTLDPAAVVPQICRQIGASGQWSGEPPVEVAARALAGRSTLLVLDNLEQLLEGPHADEALDALDKLVGRLPEVRLLCTSRTRVGLIGEHVLALGPLPVPPVDVVRPDDVLSYDAVRLFRDRARAALPGFEITADNAGDLAAVCRMLDGLPLALELAAARVRVLPPAVLAARAQDRLGLLSGGARSLPDRHRSIRAALEWSVTLLDPVETAVFRRLSVFAGGWTVEAAERVCAGGEVGAHEVLGAVTRLVDKSLVTADGSGRCWLLELVRDYSAELLGADRGEQAAADAAHQQYFVGVAEALGEQFRAHRESQAGAALGAERANLTVALERAQTRGDGTELARLLVALIDYWHESASLGECDRWLAVARQASLPAELAGRLEMSAANLALAGCDLPRALSALDAAEAAAVDADDVLLAARVAGSRGAVERFRGDLVAAAAQFERAERFAELAGEPRLVVMGRLELAEVHLLHGDPAQALPMAEQARSTAMAQPDRAFQAAATAAVATALLHSGGDPARGREVSSQALALAEQSGATWVLGDILTSCAVIQLQPGQGRDAAAGVALLRRAVRANHQSGTTLSQPDCVALLGAAMVLDGQPATGAQLLAAGRAWRRARGLAVALPLVARTLEEAEQVAAAALPAAALARARAAGEATPFASLDAVEALLALTV